MNILIIDDNTSAYKGFIQNLNNSQTIVNIQAAPSAVKGWKIFKDNRYDLVILDQFMGGGEKDGTAFLQKLKASSRTEYPEIIFVTGNYQDLPTSEIYKIDIPITLFLEKDLHFQEMLLVAAQLVMRRIAEQVRYDPMDLFGEPFLELILEECSKIITQEHHGYYGMDQQLQVGTLIRSYIQSLKMRSKWDAEDVLELSVFLMQGICRVFNLPTDVIEVLRRFLNLEEVLYSIPQYRDHFFHQIKVFLLGFSIINALNRNRCLINTSLESKDGMKMWFLASAFHDIGYPFEKMTRWLDNYIEGTLRSPGDPEKDKMIIPVEFHWGALLGKRFHVYHLQRIAQCVCAIYGKYIPSVMAEILSEFTSFVVNKPDHGLYSSLIMQNFLRYRLSDDEVDPIATAIALHNDDVSRLIKRVIGTQTFERDPLSFLLAFCDLAQDWGRILPIGTSKFGYGKFGYPVYASNQLFDESTCTLSVVLRYDREFTVQEKTDWKANIFEKYIQPSRNCWAVSSRGDLPLHFYIEYQTGDSADPVLERVVY